MIDRYHRTFQTFAMKKISWSVLLCIGLFSCEEQRKYEDFTDQIISVTIRNQNGTSIEFPDLYPKVVSNIPEAKAETMILAERLKTRGFTVEGLETGTSQLSGIRSATMKLVKETCHCEVTKTYRSTPFVSAFIVTEKIRCY